MRAEDGTASWSFAQSRLENRSGVTLFSGVLGLLALVDIKLHPELYRLCGDGEGIDVLLRLTPDQILPRWFNYHLKAAGWKRCVNNFSHVQDGENYAVLLHQLKPDDCLLAPLQTPDLRTRAGQVLQNAGKMGCRKYLTPSSLVAGNPRLYLAFVANLFNTHPGLEPLDEQEAKDYGAIETRGIVVLRAFDKVLPGSITWRRVNKPRAGKNLGAYVNALDAEEGEDIGDASTQPKVSRFKAVENTSYVVDLAKQNGWHSGCRYCGRQACVGSWSRLADHAAEHNEDPDGIIQDVGGGGRRPISGTEMLKRANTTAQKSKPNVRTIRSFKDPSITTGLFFLDLLDSIRPGIVDPALVIPVDENGPYEDRRQNAKLAISIARKMDALIFLVPEDIVDVRSRLILTFVGSLMSIAQS
ncbi:hypothetical protein FISHEDRAFT_73624 [Fistulina hepatica ATCC 64428]|uniref:Calponin-homology (CH) domain-containing protein n=1 Tax=Fistulina hepatica ATCC 64428 TaxID=1128425 RepID=A0A0D7ABR0_9AGAR|nr:hypothetical protein FISHEDRAFT_73624 [Fistulina hepatica ATCC 64428]